MKLQFDKFKLVIPLEPQMPMIHFQSNQCGVTLRATEVKPKLDNYLLKMLLNEIGVKEIDKLKKHEQFKTMFLDCDSDTNNALAYKMQITVQNPELNKVIDLNKRWNKKNPEEKNECYSIFYGNMGDSTEKVYGLFSNPTVTIICFKDKLRKLIEEHILDFFLTVNFGTMQNKGFGSFVPVGWHSGSTLDEEKKRQVANAFCKKTKGKKKCYVMEFGDVPNNNASFKDKNVFLVKMSDAIKSFYSIMKSGQNHMGYSRSFIYQYAHKELELGNEKAWMKEKEISPKLFKTNNEEKWKYGNQKYRYMRAFLGIGEKVDYGTRYNDKGYIDKKYDVTINITSKDKEFERIPSPIYFKVIKNTVFIYAYDVPKKLYGKEFEFARKDLKDKKDSICVPSKEELKTNGIFDIDDFLAKYVEYFNGELREEKIKSIKRLPKVKEVKVNA